MFSYLTSFWTPTTTEEAAIQKQNDNSSQQEEISSPVKTCCWLLRGGSDKHSSKCHEPINGLIGIFDSLEEAQIQAAWLALLSGCVHIKLGKVAMNQLGSGKPMEILTLKELQPTDETNSSFQAVFVQDDPSKFDLVSKPLNLLNLEQWLMDNNFKGQEARVQTIRDETSKANWNLWSYGANDALLMSRKLKTD